VEISSWVISWPTAAPGRHRWVVDEEEEDSIRLRGLSLIIMILFKKILMIIHFKNRNEPDYNDII